MSRVNYGTAHKSKEITMATKKIPTAIDNVYCNGLACADWYAVADEIIGQIKDLSYNRVLAIATAVCPDRVAEWSKEELLDAIREHIAEREYFGVK